LIVHGQALRGAQVAVLQVRVSRLRKQNEQTMNVTHPVFVLSTPNSGPVRAAAPFSLKDALDATKHSHSDILQTMQDDAFERHMQRKYKSVQDQYMFRLRAQESLRSGFGAAATLAAQVLGDQVPAPPLQGITGAVRQMENEAFQRHLLAKEKRQREVPLNYQLQASPQSKLDCNASPDLALKFRPDAAQVAAEALTMLAAGPVQGGILEPYNSPSSPFSKRRRLGSSKEQVASH